MEYLQILFFIVLGCTTLAGVYLLVTKPTNGNSWLAAALCGLFAGFTAVQIASEGVVMFFTNHTHNLTGLQVWWDLVMSVLIALFFILPRARKQGMNVLPWALVICATASIGLLATCARLFWLENRTEASKAKPSQTKPSTA